MNLLNVFITSLRDLLFAGIVFYLCFYLPGFLLFQKLKLKFTGVAVYFLYPIIGMLLFAAVSYILSYPHLGILLLPIVLFFDVFTLKVYGHGLSQFESIHKKPLLLVVVLSLFFSINMVGMGVFGNTISYRGEDPVHLAYIQEMKVHFPPDNPAIAGVQLKGYHFLYQFIIASVSNTFLIPVEALYFHVFPLLVSLWWGISTYMLLYVWTKKQAAGIWAVFLSMFGGGFGFILALQGHPKVNVDSVFGIAQPTVALINPQFAVSVPIIITVLFLIFHYYKKRSYALLIPIMLAVGLLPMIKIYGGVVLYAGFGFLIFIELIRRKFWPILFGVGAAIISLLTFGLFVGPGQHLIYYPLWPSHTVMLSNLPWYRYDEKYYTYSRLGVIKGILEIESFGLSLYFIGNIGIRIIGIFFALVATVYRKRLPSLFACTVFVMAFVSVMIPLFFIQTGKVFESIQFAWYYPILCSFVAAIGFASFFSLKFPRVIKGVLIAALIIASLPPAYNHYKDSGIPDPVRNRVVMNNPYFASMNYLAKNGSYNDTVLQMPPLAVAPNLFEMKRWFTMTSPDIPAFGHKRSYLAWEFITFENAKPDARLAFVQKMLSYAKGSKMFTPSTVKKELNEKGIVYVVSPDKLSLFVRGKILKEVFHNSYTHIYQVF